MYSRLSLALGAILAGVSMSSSSLAGITTAPGIGISTFATAPAGASAPDDITIGGGHVFVVFGNGGAPDGSDGKSATIAEYSNSGSLVRTFSLKGHTDGVRFDANTGLLWANQNEDANANLAIIDPTSGTTKLYTFSASAHAGGYDDLRFANGVAYFSASNPTLNASGVNTGPALVSGKINGNQVVVTPVLAGNAAATDVATGKSVTLNMTDPDSMTTNPAGDIVLDSQADGVLAIVHNPGVSQTVSRLSLTSPSGSMLTVDDTIFLQSLSGKLLLADQKANTIYAITGVQPNGVYSASPDNGLLSQLNATTGVLTPIVSGLTEPKGLDFLAGAGPSAVPLPAGVWGGTIMLVILAIAAGLRRRFSSVRR